MDAHALVHRFTQLCNAGDIEGLHEVIDPAYRQHNPMIEDGLTGIQDGMRAFLAVFPDLTASIEDVVAEGDRVAGRFTWRGTQQADFMGVAATGRTATWSSSDWWRVENGLLAEHWDVVDWAGLLGQLTGDAHDAPTTQA
jgi:predicted ester cyclase